ncbi:hypothetical protein SVAN01_10557 [Stagonosporopsis vannaccii]|nr:hypothetical protein SVAN01_10557 [Stagonosporopsis vannaccii]
MSSLVCYVAGVPRCWARSRHAASGAGRGSSTVVGRRCVRSSTMEESRGTARRTATGGRVRVDEEPRYRIPPRARVVSGSSEYVAVFSASVQALTRAWSAAANVANTAEPSWGQIPRGTDRRINPCGRVKVGDVSPCSLSSRSRRAARDQRRRATVADLHIR